MISHIFHSMKYKVKVRGGLFELTRRLVKKGHDVYVVASRAFGAPLQEEIEGIKIFRFPALVTPKLTYPIPFFPSFLSTVRNIVKNCQVDLFHVCEYVYPTSILIPLLKKFRKPVLLSTTSIAGISWSCGNRVIDNYLKLYTITFGKSILSLADRVIVFGSHTYENAKKIGLSPEKITIIPYTVDTCLFKPRNMKEQIRSALGIGPKDVVVVCVTRLYPVKGIKYLLLAAIEIVRMFPNLKIIIVGDGEWRKVYEGMVRKAGIEDKMIFTGYRTDICDVLNSSDIFVLPSISEGLPLSLMEACACAKPIVATNVGDIGDLIINNETGLLIEARNVEQLRNAICRLLVDLDHAKSMGLKARKYLLEKYNWEDIVEKYERTCYSLLEFVHNS